MTDTWTHYTIDPVAKPRMTRSDKWKKRPVVMRYRAFCDEVRARGVVLPEPGPHVLFHVPMPRSWSKAKRNAQRAQANKQRPDVDNYVKALLDALYEDDAHVWDVRATKIWSDVGCISVRSMGRFQWTEQQSPHGATG